MTQTDRLIIFTRYPCPGKAKTRLIPALGAEGAAALQRQMTEHTLTQVKSVVDARSLSVEIWFADGEPESQETDRQLMQDWLGAEWSYHSQVPGDLGTRMAWAFQQAFADRMERVITIGTDCPHLNTERIAQAFRALQNHDLVLGPATDGGYYLIGLRQFIPELFVEIAWSTSEVLQETIKIAESLELSIAYLDPLTDIDRPEDLPVWEEILQAPDRQAATQSNLSVIIPVLNEADTIQAILNSLQHYPEIEIIVVDGGSQDQTVALAEASGVTVISSIPGRSRQMNIGAQLATSEILLFLHGDTHLPAEFISLIQQTLAQSGNIAGAFELQIEGTALGLRFVEWGVKWRSRLFQLPYGDQALFLKKSTFHQLKGFSDLPIMEDFEFVRRLQQLGKVAIASAPVITSGRRWQKLGVLKTTLLNQLVIIAYFLGVSPDRLARWYRGKF
ncbi:MAG: DUF2064 domain-containing protein [Cyanobacteria bacterium CRU_2_1]|nr:DUF2064 domain-containing protein [Cyanobacteria bacterium RU_5_0]NJR61529.1 DUF2064 domain-containing protein [Cyanobacteria bacterium CRU_2_1]